MDKINKNLVALILWMLLFIFVLRVTGQLLVFLNINNTLPAMKEWQSGILPYPFLLISQILIIILYGKICIDFTKKKGFFVAPNKVLARYFLIFGEVYFISMILRYIIYMIFYPEARWLKGTIPIFAHLVLASFLIIVGYYHWKCFKT